jgi:hypothetical protein
LSAKTKPHAAHVPQEVAGSSRRSPAIPARLWPKSPALVVIPAYPRSARKGHDRLSRRRSRVRVPSLPLKYLQIGAFVVRIGAIDRRLLRIPHRSRRPMGRESPHQADSSRASPQAGRPADPAGGLLALKLRRTRFADTSSLRGKAAAPIPQRSRHRPAHVEEDVERGWLVLAAVPVEGRLSRSPAPPRIPRRSRGRLSSVRCRLRRLRAWRAAS